MTKRGQIRLSFGVIFSIIIIIAIVGVSFYAISFFLSLSKCNDIGFFYRNLETEIDKAWKSNSYRDTYMGKVPSEVESVCFGDLRSTAARDYPEEYELLRRYRVSDFNVFMYPYQEACSGGNLGVYELEHIDIEEFFCVETQEGSISVRLEKESSDALVNVNSLR